MLIFIYNLINLPIGRFGHPASFQKAGKVFSLKRPSAHSPRIAD